MNLFDFPNPVDMVEGIADADLKRLAIKSVLSATYSATITPLFETGRKKLWGEGRALQQTARAMYLSLQPMVEKNLLSLSVPDDLTDTDAMAKFQTVEGKKL